MPTHAHLVGSVGLDSTEEVLATVGALLGPHLKRVPDGEPGGRRLWISWQYPLLRSCTFLKLLEGFDDPIGTGFHQLTLADDVDPSAIRFPNSAMRGRRGPPIWISSTPENPASFPNRCGSRSACRPRWPWSARLPTRRRRARSARPTRRRC